MSLYRKKSAGQKIKLLRNKNTFGKETYMLLKEWETCFIQISNNSNLNLLPEFIFKGKRIKPVFETPIGINYQWVPKGSYRFDQMLKTIKEYIKKV